MLTPPAMIRRFDNVAILSVAHVDAPERVPTAALDARIEDTLRRVGLRPGVLEGLTGIAARRFWPRGTQPSDAATLAARAAIADAGVDPGALGILVNTSVCRDFVEPSTACIVHGNLGLPAGCLNFDLANACLGFINGMGLVADLIDRGAIELGIVVDGEDSRPVVEATLARLAGADVDSDTFRRHLATLTLGSGAAAMVLGRADRAPDALRFVGSVSLAATEHNGLCRGQRDWMETDTAGLLAAGVDLARDTWAQACATFGWDVAPPEHLVMHQVSRPHTRKVAETLALSPETIVEIYPEYGNVGPAAVPIALSTALQQGRIRPGERVALMGIGSGLNCAMAEVRRP